MAEPFSEAQRLLEQCEKQDIRQGVLAQHLESEWREERHQQELVQWCAENARRLPPLLLLTHVPNGGKREQRQTRQGRTYSPEGVRMKRTGVRAGYPDLILDVAIAPYHGLRLELKDSKGSPSAVQKAWIAALRQQDYAVEVPRGWRAARLILLHYLAGSYALQWQTKRPQSYELPPLGSHKF